MRLIIILFVLIPQLVYCQLYNSSICINISPQKHVDFISLFGKWHSVEVITHYDAENSVDDISREIFIHIINAAENYFDDDKQFKLLLSESGQTKEYLVKVDSRSNGYWMIQAPPPHTINTFNGTVQVIKSIRNQLVFTICEEYKIFTLIATRSDHQLSHFDIKSMRHLLDRRGFYVPKSVPEISSSNTSSARFKSSVSILFLAFMIMKF